VGIESIESGVPEVALEVEPAPGRAGGAGNEFVGADPSLLAAPDQAGVFKYVEVLGERRQGHGKPRGEFGGVPRTAGQPLHDRPAGGIGEGPKDPVEGRRTLRHLPKYFPFPGPCQGFPRSPASRHQLAESMKPP